MSLEWRRLFEWEKSQVVELHQGLAIVTVNGDREDLYEIYYLFHFSIIYLEHLYVANFVEEIINAIITDVKSYHV